MDFESAAVHTATDSEISLPLPFNSLAPSSPAYAWWGKIFSDARTLACYPDIRFEIADTEDKKFLKFHEAREAFMRGLIKRAEKAETEGVVMT